MLFWLQHGIAVWNDSSHAPDSQLPSFVGAAAVPHPSVCRCPQVELELTDRLLPLRAAAPELSRNSSTTARRLPPCAATLSRDRTRRSPPCRLCWNRPSALLPINRRLFCRSTVGDEHRMLESTVGSFADQPSALLPINRRRRTSAMNPGTERMRRCFCAA
jgi:hypothetical protein